MRKETSPPAQTEPTTPADSPSLGLIAKDIIHQRSEGAELVLDDRSHTVSIARESHLRDASYPAPSSASVLERHI